MLIGVVAMQHGAYYNKVNFIVQLVTSKLLVIPVSDNFEDGIDNFFVDFAEDGRVLQSSFEDGSNLTISLRQ